MSEKLKQMVIEIQNSVEFGHIICCVQAVDSCALAGPETDDGKIFMHVRDLTVHLQASSRSMSGSMVRL